MAEYEHNSEKFGYLNLDELSGVQNALGQLGFEAGKPDGKDGPNTQKGVRAFQAHALIQVDGKVGPMTREALRAELDKQASEQPPVA